MSGTTTCNRVQQEWSADCLRYARRTLSFLGNDGHTPKLHDCKLCTIHWQPVGTNECWHVSTVQVTIAGSSGQCIARQKKVDSHPSWKSLLAHKKQVEEQSTCEGGQGIAAHLSSRELGGSPTSASTFSSSCVVCRPARRGSG